MVTNGCLGKAHAGIAQSGITALLLAVMLGLTASLAYGQRSSGRDSQYAGTAGVPSKPLSTRFGSRPQCDVAPSERPRKIGDEASEEAQQPFGRDGVYARSTRTGGLPGCQPRSWIPLLSQHVSRRLSRFSASVVKACTRGQNSKRAAFPIQSLQSLNRKDQRPRLPFATRT